MTAKGVHVTGIRELSRALKETDQDTQRELRNGLRDIASRVVSTAVGKGAPGGILRASGTMKGAAIRFPAGGPGSGGDPQGFYPWLDFGGGRVDGRGVTRGGTRRPRIQEGRYLYPAISDETDTIERELGQLVERIARRNGLGVK